MLEQLLEWDREFLIFLNNLGSENFDGFWLILTKFNTWIPLFITIIILIFWKFGRKEGFWMLLSYVSMLIFLRITVTGVKFAVGRLRPNNDETINALLRVVYDPSSFSFFSGHAASSMAIATLAVLFLRKKLKWIHLIWSYTFLFAYSRIYLGVHYPIDILVGWLVGFLFASLFYKMHQKFKAPYIM